MAQKSYGRSGCYITAENNQEFNLAVKQLKYLPNELKSNVIKAILQLCQNQATDY